MAGWTAETVEWLHYVDTHSVMLTGGATRLICPLCSNEHPLCRFGEGTTDCVADGCGNPHHRSRPEEIPF